MRHTSRAPTSPVGRRKLKDMHTPHLTLLGLVAAAALAGPAAGAAPDLLDPLFGARGFTTVAIPTDPHASPDHEEANAVALDAQGRGVMAGEADIGEVSAYNAGQKARVFAFTRVGPDGVRDPSFGGDGYVTLTHPTPSRLSRQDNETFGVAMQPDGKIVFVGDGNVRDQANNNIDLIVGRLNADGSTDTSFSTDGFANVRFDAAGNRADTGRAVALQADGKIVAAGWGSIAGVGGAPNHTDFGVVRFLPDGTPDPSFGNAGAVTTGFNGGVDDRAYDLLLQPDGKIVLAGHADVGATTDLALARYNADGSLDPTFGTQGKVLHDHTGGGQEFGFAAALQPDGKILVGGYGQAGTQTDFLITRFNADGSVDRSFGDDGTAHEPVGAGSDAITHLALQPDGSILATGYAKETPTSGYDMVVSRFHANGERDLSFGPSGFHMWSFGTGDDVGRGAALRPDGRLLVVGSGTNGADQDFAAMQIRQPTATTVAPTARASVDGDRVSVTATVVSDTGRVPTGVVTFTACAPAEWVASECPPGRGTAIGTGVLVESATATGRATSPRFTLGSVGTWCVRADYPGTIGSTPSSAGTCVTAVPAVVVAPARRHLGVTVPLGATRPRLVITPTGQRAPVVSLAPRAGAITRVSANLPASRMTTRYRSHRVVPVIVTLTYGLDGTSVKRRWRSSVTAAPGRLRGQWLGKRLGAWDYVPPSLTARQKAGIRGYPDGFAVVRQKQGGSATFAPLTRLQ